MIHYYKKLDPRIGIVLDGGAKIMFTPVNREIGYFATDNDHVNQQLQAAIAGGRGALKEIDASEFNDLLQKKMPESALKPRWRDEIVNSELKLQKTPPPIAISNPPHAEPVDKDDRTLGRPVNPPLVNNPTRPVATVRA